MKLIVSDLDGTLMSKNEVSLSKSIKNSIYSQLCSGNLFAVASGRNYTELKALFSEFEKDIYFICNDGALGVYKEDTFFENSLDKQTFESFKTYAAHGKYVTYVKSANTSLERELSKKYRGHVMTIDSIYDIKGNIYKITDFDKSIPCSLPLVYKDYSMHEYIAYETDKSSALKVLISKLKVPKHDTIVFGDNLNDLGMFAICGKSFAVANAIPKVKKCADKVTQNIEKEIINVI